MSEVTGKLRNIQLVDPVGSLIFFSIQRYLNDLSCSKRDKHTKRLQIVSQRKL